MAIKTSACGEAKFPHLSNADYAFNSNGVYHTKLTVKKSDAQEDIKSIDAEISKLVAEEHKKKPGQTGLIKRAPLPYTIEGDEVTFKFKCNASGVNSKTKEPFTQRPTLVDHNLEQIPSDKNIWGGSIMRINYEIISYSNASIGIGASLRLKGAQIKKLVEGSNINISGFEPVEPITEVF